MDAFILIGQLRGALAKFVPTLFNACLVSSADVDLLKSTTNLASAPLRNSSKENGIMKGKFPGKSWLNSFLNRWFMYLYPFLIIGIEVALRAADKEGVMMLEMTSFIGPSLAAAGAAFVVPLTAKKPMTQEKLEKLKKDIILPAIPAQSTVTVDETAIVDAILKLSQKRYSITSPEEDDMRNICLGFAIILTALWVWALWLSLHPSNRSLWFIPIGLIPGLINCLFGLVLTEAREGVK